MSDDLRNQLARAKAAYDDHRDIASQQEPDATSEYIVSLEAALAEIGGAQNQLDEAINQLDSARYSVEVLERRLAAIEPAPVKMQPRSGVSPDHAWDAVEAALFRAIAEGKDDD
jgi:DNA repair ATPase RecN